MHLGFSFPVTVLVNNSLRQGQDCWGQHRIGIWVCKALNIKQGSISHVLTGVSQLCNGFNVSGGGMIIALQTAICISIFSPVGHLGGSMLCAITTRCCSQEDQA